MLALHGWLDNAGTFDNLAPLLIKDNELSILCIDLPGHGLSSHLPKGTYYYLCWDGVMTIRRIQQHFKWTEPLTLMGHSLGGAISFLYAATYPDDVKQYVSIDIASPAVKPIEKICKSIGKSIDDYLKIEKIIDLPQRSGNYTKCIDTVELAHNGNCSRSACEVLMRRGMKEVDSRKGEQVQSDEPQYVFCRDLRLKVPALGFLGIDDVMIYAKHVKCRILNIRAINDTQSEIDKDFYKKVIDLLKESASYLEYVEVKGTHHLHLNNADAISDTICKFLQN